MKKKSNLEKLFQENAEIDVKYDQIHEKLLSMKCSSCLDNKTETKKMFRLSKTSNTIKYVIEKECCCYKFKKEMEKAIHEIIQ